LGFGERNLETKRLNHRERLEACLNGDMPDRVPVALWRHSPVDDQTPDGLAAATLHFQQTYDFDLVKVTPASSYSVKDLGVEDEWRGASEGTRDYTRTVINFPEDWERIPVVDPKQEHLAAMLASLELLVKELGPDVPILQTIFNPLSVAKHLAGGAKLIVHLRQYPDAVHAGLKSITESICMFVEAAAQTGIAGLFYAIQHAQYGLLSEDEYRSFGRDYDMQVLQNIPGLWLNMLHLHGKNVMFSMVADYPIQVINWHDRETPPNLAEGQSRFSGVVCGGLERVQTMVLGDPEMVTVEANQAIEATEGRRFILGTGCVLPIIAPHGNILAARRSVE
jgi:uroporphyrinogen decarboxylase